MEGIFINIEPDEPPLTVEHETNRLGVTATPERGIDVHPFRIRNEVRDNFPCKNRSVIGTLSQLDPSQPGLPRRFYR